MASFSDLAPVMDSETHFTIDRSIGAPCKVEFALFRFLGDKAFQVAMEKLQA